MRTVLNLAVILALLVAAACSQTAKHNEDPDEQIEWKEMDEFHMIMAEVFHPLKDSGNLEPIKSRAEELAGSAAAWPDSELPEKVDNEEVKGLLFKLSDGARALADQVKAGAADEEIKQNLTDLHDIFHGIQESWYGGGEEHHEH